MGERSVIAFFRTERRAKEAVEQLKAQGFETVDLSRFSFSPREDGSDLDNPIAEPPSALSTVTGAPVSGRDAGVLKAADNYSSGMADGSDEFGAEDLSVTVVTDEARFEEAEEILKQMGGRL
ncbi:hypothetical protein GCM10011571_08350 [Marinithermofilum abyssi]|uniref:General stress protein 17M-like domain-containing protein n=1 Tax=Marinithermofilum abyssi TaxID=1571185 RepID=A0A8J2VDE8_9BACL|nr:hypothetical protein [Marinithermofilum abyssi]GGE09382.1 hypothetical protein GCM10011571_08350 [Marinithermofilum abyssi]